MSEYKAKFLEDLRGLIKSGKLLYLSFALILEYETEDSIKKKGFQKSELPNFYSEYESWYSQSLLVIKQILPDRFNDFTKLYIDEKRKEISTSTYTIHDALVGTSVSRGSTVVVSKKSAYPKLVNQFNILSSVEPVFNSSLTKIRELVKADVFDSELHSAEELIKCGFFRAAGAVAGVVLEKHLLEVLTNHNISSKKKNPALNDLNEILKNEGIIDIPTWRHIQLLADIRNLCDHNKEREPTNMEVQDLVSGVNKIIKTIF